MSPNHIWSVVFGYCIKTHCDANDHEEVEENASVPGKAHSLHTF